MNTIYNPNSDDAVAIDLTTGQHVYWVTSIEGFVHESCSQTAFELQEVGRSPMRPKSCRICGAILALEWRHPSQLQPDNPHFL